MKSILTTDKANQPYGFVQLDNTGKIPTTIAVQGTSSYAVTASYALNGGGIGINTGSLATTSSNIFTGVQTITGSTGISQYGDVQFPGYATLADVHAVNEGPWIGRWYNDTFSTSSAALAYFAYDDGKFVFHNESTQSIGIQVNGYSAENGLLIYEDKVAFVNNIEVSGSTIILSPVPQNFPIAGGNDVEGMVAFDKDYIYYCTVDNASGGGIHIYNQEPGSPWDTYNDNGPHYWMQVGPSQENGGNLAPQAGWYFIDDTSTVRQITSDSFWLPPYPSTPIANGTGWLCSVDAAWTYSNSTNTITLYETSPNLALTWKRTPWNALPNQSPAVTGSVDITGSLTLNGVTGDLRPYKVYTALLTQTGTSTPTATVLENTIGNLTWYRDDIGAYYVHNSEELFTLNKTFVLLTHVSENYNGTTSYGNISETDIYTYTTDTSFTNTDGVLLNTPIEIRVYN